MKEEDRAASPKRVCFRQLLGTDTTLTSPYHNTGMRTTVTLDRDVYEAATQLARTSGQRLGTVISELARRGSARAQPPVNKWKKRFPAFEVPPGTPIISAASIQEVIDEEGFF